MQPFIKTARSSLTNSPKRTTSSSRLSNSEWCGGAACDRAQMTSKKLASFHILKKKFLFIALENFHGGSNLNWLENVLVVPLKYPLHKAENKILDSFNEPRILLTLCTPKAGFDFSQCSLYANRFAKIIITLSHVEMQMKRGWFY